MKKILLALGLGVAAVVAAVATAVSELIQNHNDYGEDVDDDFWDDDDDDDDDEDDEFIIDESFMEEIDADEAEAVKDELKAAI